MAQAYQYVVEGRGEFPEDMLRYDQADFATLADEGRARWRADRPGGRGRRDVRIVGEVEPTVARWASFGWTVSKIEALARKARA